VNLLEATIMADHRERLLWPGHGPLLGVPLRSRLCAMSVDGDAER